MARILVVDDDPDFQDMMSLVLESAGYAVENAYDGARALGRIAADPPDLVLLDVMMTTETEGIEVAQKLRADPRTRGIPLVMLTSVNVEKRFPAPLGPDPDWLPVDRFLDKPVKPALLLATVSELLEKKANHG